MTTFRVGPYLSLGDPITLAAADQDGMRKFISALHQARDSGHAAFDCGDGVKHQIAEKSGAADIDISPYLVVWRFDRAKLNEIIELIEPLIESDTAAHQYVDDMKIPTTTLVLSVNEYPADVFEN
ncbi:hypothetical protein FZI91_21200 [Mycobacterium sp. CBMA271]|uniref:hypothetical protein n=1 Tax=unclassified Mycobacteroides TaxID=2618759 RepID=UPI0012DD6D9D|nr:MULTISPECIES: hypothetical protein [unclassified Mycobacteroides]MUM19602.1 hypothetical protein [Mycobacteroides sp. CBMA 326]MUM24204.1 hypothetical protein [Mycobacteroides sp. CBMA 271]